MNMVPVDMCANAIIAQVYETAIHFEKCKAENLPYEVAINNFESSTDSPITNYQFMYHCSKYGIQYPSISAIWYYFIFFVESDWAFTLALFFLHTIPAAILDGVAVLFGKKAR